MDLESPKYYNLVKIQVLQTPNPKDRFPLPELTDRVNGPS